MEKIAKVETIHCGGCERRAVNAVKDLPGVENAVASKDTQLVTITLNAELSNDAIKAALEGANFTVVSID
ncbi:MAG: heavy-metal-associated domain-containing protein [Clostridiales bacterium]|nr:heavy-metal-associated domain-containing protein [Clostridiales bacterium]MBE5784827.1 heavy-metal-associated domain-containing protein [Clostridiales bacterium]